MSDDTKKTKSIRIKLLLLFAVFSLPIAASYFMFYVVQPSGTVNYGELLPPKPLTPVALAQLDGKSFDLAQLKGKWVVIQFDDAPCVEACEKKLYGMRQVRLALGKEQSRVERLWVVLGNQSAPALDASYGGTLVLVGGDALASQFPAKGDIRQHMYVIDPLGNVMMRYDRDPDLKRMKKDLERLLKASQVG